MHGLDENMFLEDERTQEAVLWNFVIIGEATTKIMQNHKEFVAIHPEIAWYEMRGLRNSAVHEYLGIEYEIIWKSVKRDIPKLIKNLEKIIDNKNS